MRDTIDIIDKHMAGMSVSFYLSYIDELPILLDRQNIATTNYIIMTRQSFRKVSSV